MDNPYFELAARRFTSRLLVGTARYPNPKVMLDSLEASAAEIITVSVRRLNLRQSSNEGILHYLDRNRYLLLPNTAGCYTAKDAVLTAELARESLQTNWIKLEVIGDERTLYPDVRELLKAAEELVRKDFIVLPYCTDDPVVCRRLADLGCAAVMPLGSPIGSGMGILNPYNLRILREQISIPLILDAGIGTASDAALAMELGVDALLVNTAIAQAQHPVAMACAIKLACQAGRLAYLAGRIPKKQHAEASSPVEGVIITK